MFLTKRKFSSKVAFSSSIKCLSTFRTSKFKTWKLLSQRHFSLQIKPSKIGVTFSFSSFLQSRFGTQTLNKKYFHSSSPKCNSKETLSNNSNPLLFKSLDEIPPLIAFDKILPSHFFPAVQACISQCEVNLKEIERKCNEENVGIELLDALQSIDYLMESVWGPIKTLFQLKNSPEIRKEYELCLAEIVKFSTKLSQYKPVYGVFKRLRQSKEWNTFDATTRRIIELNIRHSELEGIGLEGEKRREFNSIKEELSQLSKQFYNNVLDSTEEFALTLTNQSDVVMLPAILKNLASFYHNQHQKKLGQIPDSTPEKGPWRITLNHSVSDIFLQNCVHRHYREKVYMAKISIASQGKTNNVPIIEKILSLRHRKAELLGFKNYAELSLASKMAKDPEEVFQLLEKLRVVSFEYGKKEFEELQQFAKDLGTKEPLMHWDIPFWIEKLREKKYALITEQVKKYFPFSKVLNGLFQLFEKLFKIVIKEDESSDIPKWDPSIRFFNVFDKITNSKIASFYLDPYLRTGEKGEGAWMDPFKIRRTLNGKLILPVAHIVCNFPPPTEKQDSLLSWRELHTLFHEFGHALQHMLTERDEWAVSGSRSIEWDVIELPSQFMENWTRSWPTMQFISSHIETGQSVSKEMFEKLNSMKNYRAASNTLRQLTFGFLDLYLHSQYDSKQETIFDVQKKVLEKTSFLPMLEKDRFLCSFLHIFTAGYAAGYYSYKWAEVLSADAFEAFEEVGLNNEQAISELGMKFRKTILGRGGSLDPMIIYKEFRGKDPDPNSLLRQYGLLEKKD